MNKRLKYINDDDFLSEEELLKIKQQRIEQAAIRLEQKERHLKLQEEKVRLLEEKRRLEEIERRKRSLKKAFFAFLKGVGTIAAVGTSIMGLLSYLRQEAQYSQEAAVAYRSIIRILEEMLSAVRHGGRLTKIIFIKVFDKISSVTKSLWRQSQKRFFKTKASYEYKSKVMDRYIKKDAAIKLGIKNRLKLDSSVYSFNKYDEIASAYVNRSIRLYDRKYNDIIGMIAWPSLASKVLVPILIPMLKTAVIGGVAGAITGSLKSNVTDPIIKRIVNNIKLVAENKSQDETYIQAIGNKISEDMSKLLNILKKEKAYVSTKLESVWNRIKGLFKKK